MQDYLFRTIVWCTKFLTKMSTITMLSVCACVLCGVDASFADNESGPTEKRIAQLPSFVPMEKNADILSDMGLTKTKIEGCIKNYTIGKEKANWLFWSCIVRTVGKDYWDRNYEMIICRMYKIAAEMQGTDVAETCKNCSPDPCTNTSCNKVSRENDCCDIIYIKCVTDAIMGDTNHSIVAASICDRELSTCYQKNAQQ